MPKFMRGPFPWLALAFVADLFATLLASYFLAQGPIGQEQLTALTLVSVTGATLLFALSWKIIDFQVVRSIKKLAADVRAVAFGSARESIGVERYPILNPLPEAVGELGKKLIQARSELKDGLAGATAKAEENSARLAAILNDLHEGVVVCNLRHQVVLFNSVAMDMLGKGGPFGLGRSIFETIDRGAVQHTLEGLIHRRDQQERGTPFLVGNNDGTMLFQARMTVIRGADGELSGYVVTMVDAGPQVAALARRDALLREVSEGLEMPLLRLCSAADNPDIVRNEAAIIEKTIKHVTHGYQRALAGWWPMTDIHSGDFFALVARRFENGPLKVSITGLPVWLHADSHSLSLTLETLLRQIAERFDLAEMDLAAGSHEDEAWVEIGWSGGTAAKPALANWLGCKLPGLSGMTIRDVLVHHAGDQVRQEHKDGRSCLMLPMRKGVELHVQPKSELPHRPEFYDLGLLDAARDIGEMGRQPLRTLTFVVFDTETTGLQPSAGDQIVQIGAVRVVNGRILSSDSFNRIVNPERPIPPESIKFHGITDDMVVDKPPARVVLPQFRAYASDAVLVAHNAAFDLKFLRMRERDFGIKFDNPVLDTMMLSSHLDGAEAGHSLDDICERFGIEITDRHTALGDAIVTAAVLLRQIEMLEAQGITTLDQVVTQLDMNAVLHQRQQALDGATRPAPVGGGW